MQNNLLQLSIKKLFFNYFNQARVYPFIFISTFITLKIYGFLQLLKRKECFSNSWIIRKKLLLMIILCHINMSFNIVNYYVNIVINIYS